MIHLIIHDRPYTLTEKNEDWLFAKLALKYNPSDRVKIIIDGKEEEEIALDELINF